MAIDIVRFLLAEEREKKLCEKESKEQKKTSATCKTDDTTAVEDPNTNIGDSNCKEKTDENIDQDENTGSQYFTAS